MKTSARREIFELPVAERLQLVEDLWDSIAADAAELPVTAEQRVELDRRLTALEADSAGGKSWNEVKSSVLRRK